MTIKADSAANVINYYYTRNQYKLTWDLDGGVAENYTEGSVYYGAQIRIPKPVKEGHSYTWDTEPVTVMPAEDLAYKAVWTPNIYQISLDPNGGNVVEGDLATRTITFGEAYGSLPVMEKENYTFEGWYTDKTGGSKLTETSAVELGHDHVIYAQYKPIEFTITYYGTEDAQNDNPETYNVETGLFSLEKASRRGYTFEGWYDNENLEGEEVRAVSANETGNKTFYAKWRENHYKIVYHSNEGKGYSKEQQLAYTEISTLLKTRMNGKDIISAAGPRKQTEKLFMQMRLRQQACPGRMTVKYIYMLSGSLNCTILFMRIWKAQKMQMTILPHFLL